MTVEFKAGDYVVVTYPKKTLLKVGEVLEDSFTGYTTGIETDADIYQHKDVFANLGKTPPYVGSVNGVSLERYFRSSEAVTGDVHWFFKPEKEARQALHKALDVVYGKLKKRKLHTIFPMDIHVMLAKGKYSGLYHKFKDGTSRITLRPKPADYDTSSLDYVVAHECGHGVWYDILTDKHRAKWIQLYHKSVKVERISKDTMNKVREWFEPNEATGGYISTIRGQLEEDLIPIYDAIIDHLSVHHSLDVDHLDTLIQSNDFDMTWLPSVVYVSDIDTHITEYATKNVEEFFAEAFAFYITGKVLPKDVTSLLTETI